MEAWKIYGAEELEYQDDPFNRLTDDLIVAHIFEKVCEAKSLLKCSLVSKKFSSLIYQIKTGSFKIPLQIPKPEPDLPPTLAVYAGKLLHVGILPIPFVQILSSDLESIPSRTKFDPTMVNKIIEFLRKFTRMESLLVELDYSASFDGLSLSFHKEPVIKWILDSRSAAFILLMASISFSEDEAIYPTENESHSTQSIVFDCHMALSVCICMLMRNLVLYLPESLVRLVITDSKNRGTTEFGESDLFAMRPGNQEQLGKGGRFSLGKLWDESFFKKVGQKPEFAEATSAMKTGGLGSLLLGKGKRDNVDADDYLKVTQAFQGALTIYIETVMEMLKEIWGTF